MARLYANENFSFPVVLRLRELGHDILTTNDVGVSNQRVPDDQVLEFAISQRRAVVTHNRDDFFADSTGKIPHMPASSFVPIKASSSLLWQFTQPWRTWATCRAG